MSGAPPSGEAMDQLRRIAHRIGECRRRHGWSEEELARRAGVTLKDMRALRDSDPSVSAVVLLELVRASGAQVIIVDDAAGTHEAPASPPGLEPTEDRF